MSPKKKGVKKTISGPNALVEKEMREQPQVHTCERLKERYGLYLDHHDYADLCARVLTPGEANVFISPVNQDGTRSLHAIRLRGVWVSVLYDWEAECIVTALPPETLRPAPGKLTAVETSREGISL